MRTLEPQRILVADDNPIFRETLAQRLRILGHDVITAETGERAFLILRDWSRPIGWLDTRAALPGLIDGWILRRVSRHVQEQEGHLVGYRRAGVLTR
jgi:DNA-binding response OmpR family regulator